MSRKDYVKIAAALVAARQMDAPFQYNVALRNAAQELAKVFAADNPRFDAARFYAAAGVL